MIANWKLARVAVSFEKHHPRQMLTTSQNQSFMTKCSTCMTCRQVLWWHRQTLSSPHRVLKSSILVTSAHKNTRTTTALMMKLVLKSVQKLHLAKMCRPMLSHHFPVFLAATSMRSIHMLLQAAFSITLAKGLSKEQTHGRWNCPMPMLATG
jgi:hypothetical protein